MPQNWAAILSEARLWSNDNAAVLVTADADALTIFNGLLRGWKGQSEDRIQELTQTGWATGAWSGTVRSRDSTLTTIRRIIAMWPTGGSATLTPTGPELEYVEPWEMDRYYADDIGIGVTIVAAGPSFWSYLDLGTSDITAATGTVGKKRVFVFPLPSGAVLSFGMRAELEPTLPTIGTDIPDLDVTDAHGLALSLAYMLALRAGKPDPMVNGIAAQIPPAMQALVGWRQEKSNVQSRVTGASA